jgi:hypothetical protein
MIEISIISCIYLFIMSCVGVYFSADYILDKYSKSNKDYSDFKLLEKRNTEEPIGPFTRTAFVMKAQVTVTTRRIFMRPTVTTEIIISRGSHWVHQGTGEFTQGNKVELLVIALEARMMMNISDMSAQPADTVKLVKM